MAFEARYLKNHVEYRESYDTAEEALSMMKFGFEMLWLQPLGIWEDGDKILSHDDVLEYGEDDETI